MSPIALLLIPRSEIDSPMSKAVFGVSLCFILTSVISVVLRLWAKQINRSKVVTEDYLCVTSLVLVIGMFICLILSKSGGITALKSSSLTRTYSDQAWWCRT